jgi:DNA helicase-2/ATP-dependent DNA helicase PcrA
MLDYEHSLNPGQLEAVTTAEGALLIIAGAGSGKTRVITYRIAYLLDKGVPQSAILALTFTNKAAREMADRVRSLTQKKLQNLTVSTFHAFGVKILRESCGLLGWRENFSIYDETDRNQLIKDTARELGLYHKEDSFDSVKIGALVSNIKTGRWHWGAGDRVYAGEGEERFMGEFPGYSRFYDEYQSSRKIYNAFDFDDLIVMPVALFRAFPDTLAAYRKRYQYILVDEFQDTSACQYELLRLLADKNVAVVGDDDQSIYSWRGANYENIRAFERDFPGVKEIRLLQNYRSTGTILAAANGVIAHNTNRKDKELWSGKGTGKPVQVFYPEDETAEAEFIAETILSLRASEGLRNEDFGVLMRAAKSQSHALEEALLNANIPYVMSGGTSFFERKEIKDVVSYLKVCANRDDDVNLLRIINTPRRGIGKKSIEAVSAIATGRGCSLWQAIQSVLEKERAGGENLFQDDSSGGGLDADVSEGEGGFGGFTRLIESHRAALLSGRDLSRKTAAFLEAIGYNEHILAENQNNEKLLRLKLLNVERLLESMSAWEETADDPSLYNYLNRITLASQDDQNADEGGKVNLMTIHAAKGLEFPVVFIAGVEEGLIPSARSLEEDPENIEEERRLFYVAITRAKEGLFLTSCRKRKRNKSVSECEISRFFDEIPQDLVELHEPDAAPVDAATAAQYFAAFMKGR